MTTLVRDGLELNYEVHGGSGPALLLPYVNFSWPEVLDLRPFLERFTVVTGSPRGFAASGRVAADAPYRGSDLADDLVAIMEAAGFERFSVLGYSFSGAFAPWIAQLTGKVDAVVAGGFPIAGDYAYLWPDIQRRTEAAKADPEAWAYVDAHFDARVALAFYRELSELPPDSLVTDLSCPLFAFWGDQDEEIALAGGVDQLAFVLDRHGLEHASFPGRDHDGMLAHLDDAVPSVLAWLDQL
ncbi:MAG TPA: alpha/beta hydrolase [Gaiellaceae bacterium]|nr:alpha/beta hydrolase [Gaiellaceae bacterium]